MTRVAFCGLGQMGTPMARRLVDAGHDLTVWNRTEARTAPLVAAGARAAATPAEAAAEADVAITMLANPTALDEVALGPSGLAAGLRPGAVFVDMSTVGPDSVRWVAGRLPDGVGTIDAPVLGSVPAAADGTLKLFVGGDDTLLERWAPLLGTFGTLFRFGPLGSGAAMKLVANSTLGALMTGLAEALTLADAFGLDESIVLDVLGDSPIGLTARGKRRLIESGTYPPNFKLALARKDLELVGEAAERLGLDLPLARAARALYQSAAESGLGELDYSAAIAHLRGRPASLPGGPV
jgi:3-hydroxyisobutyrate dehydrogenase-like beta-hydroxyacid dehydrogenase